MRCSRVLSLLPDPFLKQISQMISDCLIVECQSQIDYKEFVRNTCKACLWIDGINMAKELAAHDKEHAKTFSTLFDAMTKYVQSSISVVSCEGFWLVSCVSRLMPPLSPSIFHLCSLLAWANCCEATLLTSVKLLSHPSHGDQEN